MEYFTKECLYIIRKQKEIRRANSLKDNGRKKKSSKMLVRFILWWITTLVTLNFCDECLLILSLEGFRTIVFIFIAISTTVSADMSTSLLQVFVKLGNLHGTSIYVLYLYSSAWAGYDTRPIFKRSLTGLNSEFSFS